jgi:hypothetical protein
LEKTETVPLDWFSPEAIGTGGKVSAQIQEIE